MAQTAFIDIVSGGFDAGVRYGEHLDQDMIAVSLGPPERFAIIAAPQYIAQHGRPVMPQDLLQHSCIRSRFDSGAMPDWEFEKDGRVVMLSPKARLVAGSSQLGIRAALDGLGLFATFEGYVREDVAAGRLVSVLQDWLMPFPGPFLYYPSRRQPPPALAAFVGFVAEWKRGRRGGAPSPSPGGGGSSAP